MSERRIDVYADGEWVESFGPDEIKNALMHDDCWPRWFKLWARQCRVGDEISWRSGAEPLMNQIVVGEYGRPRVEPIGGPNV